METITQHRDELRKELTDFITSALKEVDLATLPQKSTDELFNVYQVLKSLVRIPDKKEQFTVYTDGSYSQQTKTGAGAYVILQEKGVVKKGGQKIIGTNNSVAELTAIKCALKELPAGSDATVITDSQYAINALTGKANVKKNKELVSEILNFAEQKKLSVSYLWVKGHSGNTYNEMCDKLCDEIAGNTSD